MSTINVIFAITAATELLVRQNFQRDAEGNRLRTDLTEAQARKLKSNISGFWKVPNIAGTNYTIVSWYVPNIVDEGETELKWVKFLTDKWPSKFIIIGAWNRDGSMFSVEGIPVYPIHNKYMLIFPDDVTYDASGNEISRTGAVAPKEVNKMLGWADRRWS